MKIGIIGAGNIAEKHLEVLSSFEDVELAGISSRGNPRIDALAERFSIDQKFNDYRKMLDTLALDGVLVLVSANQIETVASDCLSRGIPTLLEKPPGLNALETQKLAQKAESSNCINMVGVNRRFYGVMQQAREAILEHGPLVSVLVEGPERLAEVKAVGIHPPEIIEGLIVANGMHCIDLLRFFGGDVVKVHAENSTWNETQKNSFGALMRFENGATGHYVSHWISPGGWSVVLYGVGIRIYLNPLERGTIIDANRTETPMPADEIDTKFKPGIYRQNRYFVDCIRDKRKACYPGSDLADALKTMQLIEAIRAESA